MKVPIHIFTKTLQHKMAFRIIYCCKIKRTEIIRQHMYATDERFTKISLWNTNISLLQILVYFIQI